MTPVRMSQTCITFYLVLKRGSVCYVHLCQFFYERYWEILYFLWQEKKFLKSSSKRNNDVNKLGFHGKRTDEYMSQRDNLGQGDNEFVLLTVPGSFRTLTRTNILTENDKLLFLQNMYLLVSVIFWIWQNQSHV